MEIEVKELGKKYQKEWVFRNLDFNFQSNRSYGIIGPNGSGKTTLLQILTGFIPPSKGDIIYRNQDKEVSPETFFKYTSVAAPYLELVEEFTLTEFLRFHFKFKRLDKGLQINDMINLSYLEGAEHKLIKYFSSGMKQRLKLALCLFADSPIIFLDEPSSNLDEKANQWFRDNLEERRNDRMTIICSNQVLEFDLCDELIDLQNHKNPTG